MGAAGANAGHDVLTHQQLLAGSQARGSKHIFCGPYTYCGAYNHCKRQPQCLLIMQGPEAEGALRAESSSASTHLLIEKNKVWVPRAWLNIIAAPAAVQGVQRCEAGQRQQRSHVWWRAHVHLQAVQQRESRKAAA